MDGRRVGGAAVLAFFSLFVGIRGEVRLEVLKGRFQTSHGGELTSWSNLDLRFAPRMGRNSEFRVYPRGLDGIDRFYRTDDPWKMYNH